MSHPTFAAFGYYLVNYKRTWRGSVLSAFLLPAMFLVAMGLTVGAVFIAEAASVMLQVGYFKLTKRRYGEGRRLFKMAPLHHHFEMLGWSETQVTMRFWMLSMMAGLIGVAMALVQF